MAKTQPYDGTPQTDELGGAYETYVRRPDDHDRQRRRRNPVYRSLMDVGRVDALLPDGREVTLTHQMRYGLHWYWLYEAGHKRPIHDCAGLRLDRDQVWGWTSGLRVGDAAGSK